MDRPSPVRRAWSRLPGALRSWLETYGGPLLGLVVVAALLLNLSIHTGEQTAGTAEETLSAGPGEPPQLFTVTPDYARQGVGGPAQRAVTAQASRPVQLDLAGGTTVPVAAVGTSEEGALDVPDDIRVAGWWRGGARLGDPFGSMLIAAHVDSRTQGLGPYSVLLSVRPGARFTVTGEHDLTQTFAVAERRVVPRDELGSVPDIFSPSGKPRLTMVTCAGPYEQDNGGYQNLAVVTARPTGPASVGG